MPKPRLHSVVEVDSPRPDGHVFLPVILCFGFFCSLFFWSRRTWCVATSSC